MTDIEYIKAEMSDVREEIQRKKLELAKLKRKLNWYSDKLVELRLEVGHF